MEFALVYGNDWFYIPVPSPIGSAPDGHHAGRHRHLRRADADPAGRAVPGAGQSAALVDVQDRRPPGAVGDCLLLAPTLGQTDDADPIEDVLITRDPRPRWPGRREHAAGRARRRRRRLRGLPGPAATRTARRRRPRRPRTCRAIAYTLEHPPPDNWIPLVPVLPAIGAASYSGGARWTSPARAARCSSWPPPPNSSSPAEPFYLTDRVVTPIGVSAQRYLRRTRLPDGSTVVWLAQPQRTRPRPGCVRPEVRLPARRGPGRQNPTREKSWTRLSEHGLAGGRCQTGAVSQSVGTAGEPVGEGRPLTPESYTWPLLALAVAILPQILVPAQYRIGPPLIVPIIETAAWLTMAAIAALPGAVPAKARPVLLAALGVLAAGNVIAAARLAALVLDGGFQSHHDSANRLLVAGAMVLTTNLITYAVLYWQLDGGGPTGRVGSSDTRYRDFDFPQMAAPERVPPHWQPEFADYLYLAYTNVVAFSPRPTPCPWTRRAKGLMTLQIDPGSLAVLVVVLTG